MSLCSSSSQGRLPTRRWSLIWDAEGEQHGGCPQDGVTEKAYNISSDVLPWQCRARYGDVCGNALFVDVDYPDLMLKKRDIVLETPQLRELLGQDVSVSETDKDPVLIKSSTYCQVACDLRELETLRRTLASLTPLAESEVLFVAEVSVTYMDTLSADSVIEWASSIGKG